MGADFRPILTQFSNFHNKKMQMLWSATEGFSTGHTYADATQRGVGSAADEKSHG